MGLRGWIAGLLGFGITAGLAGVYVAANGWSISDVPIWTWAPWGAAIVALGLTSRQGWPLFLTAGSAALLFATLPVLDTDLWVLPLVGAVALILLARFSGLSWLAGWAAKAQGTFGAGVLIWALGWAGDAGGIFQAASGTEQAILYGSLAGIIVLGWWPRGGLELGDNED